MNETKQKISPYHNESMSVDVTSTRFDTYRRQNDRLSFDEINLFGFIRKESWTDFRSFRIKHNGYIALLIFGRLTDPFKDSTVPSMITVRKIESSNVHTRFHESFQLRNLPTRWSDCANNLRFTKTDVYRQRYDTENLGCEYGISEPIINHHHHYHQQLLLTRRTNHGIQSDKPASQHWHFRGLRDGHGEK